MEMVLGMVMRMEVTIEILLVEHKNEVMVMVMVMVMVKMLRQVECGMCPTGADCSQPGSQVGSLMTAQGYWKEEGTNTFYR